MLEGDYQTHVIKILRDQLPGCVVLKNDSSYLQGIPDLTVLYQKHWAWLEVKISEKAPAQPNQEYYIELANELSFGAFIYPENEQEVLRELQQSFKLRRKARVS